MPHKEGTCPSCGLRSFKRMSDREKRAHRKRHDAVSERRKKARKK